MGVAPLKILVVDDSALFRKILRSVLQSDPRFDIVGGARNGEEALQMVRDRKPDAVVLDVQMPVMDGLTTLEHMRRDAPQVGVIMFSGLTQFGAEATVRALELGAFDFVPKPASAETAASVETVRRELIPKLTFLHTRKALRLVSGREYAADAAAAEPRPAERAPVTASPPPAQRKKRAERRLVAIGVSTGGPQALARIWPHLPADLDAAVVVVQHMPPVFTATLAQRLDEISPLPTREARDGEPVKSGTALLAPGGRHMTVGFESRKQLVVKLNDDPPEHNCRPSVDVLFRSVAACCGGESVGVVMTGMGADGAAGLREMKKKGAYALAQNRETSTVFGMPRKVVEEKTADEVLGLDDIAPTLVRLVKGE